MAERQQWSGRTGLPLVIQLIGLLLGALAVAQLVTLTLTILLPPAQPRRYELQEIATALQDGQATPPGFDRVIQSGPPDLSGVGWFVSGTARAKLAAMLHEPVTHVALGFYTQLPVGGSLETVAPPKQLPADAEHLQTSRVDDGDQRPRVLEAALLVPKGTTPMQMIAMLQHMPAGPAGGGFPGGGFPGGGHPGGGFPGTGLPGGGFPQSLPRLPAPTGALPSRPPQQQPRLGSPPTQPPQSANQASQTTTPTTAPPIDGGQPKALPNSRGLDFNRPGARPEDSPDFPNRAGAAVLPRRPFLGGADLPQSTGAAAVPTRSPSTQQTERDVPAPRETTSPQTAVPTPSAVAGADVAEGEGASTTGETAGTALAPLAPPMGAPVSLVRPRAGFFGLSRSPYVEGDFVAGERLADGRWAVVFPHPEGFPNAWQRRVALWFLLSLLAVAPIAWLFARRIVVPLGEFAHAADVLGRDPAAAVLPLRGPAEIGRAAHAFNQMQSRLRSFVDDRAAMIGAISHDLRTPLTRLRFRIEDVAEDQQEGLRHEVAAMEALIASVISFMRDASTPNARERCDLAELVDDVVESASSIGGNVELTRVDHAMVDIDALGMRRVLDNLLTNALKYGGGRTRVGLRVTQGSAIADIVDDGPGVPEIELERVFEPFYRSEEARRSGLEGSGLGLAVCRSIARAHGGDVALFRSRDGFTARVTLPLAFETERQAA